jgi:hypothetical protein
MIIITLILVRGSGAVITHNILEKKLNNDVLKFVYM